MTASASAPAQRSGVIAPYGGTLVDLMVAEADRAAVKATATKTIECSDRNACDVELLCVGGFSPLRGFMHQEDYDAVVSGHRLAAGQLFGLPIVMDTDRDDVVVGDKLLLTYKGQDLAVLEVEDKWEPNKVAEAKGCYGTTSIEHPAVRMITMERKRFYLGGSLQGLALPERVFPCKTPAEVRAGLPEGEDVVAFQCRNPIHRAHYELFTRALHAQNVSDNAVVLVHPTCGPTQQDDIPGAVRFQTYERLAAEVNNDSIRWAYLPYAMHMAGPREALQHMIIRRNYGCTHFIIGRDMAGCKSSLTGDDFYGPYDAQNFAKECAPELTMETVPSLNLVYTQEEGYVTAEHAEARGLHVKKLSGTQFRKMLRGGEEIPEWFAFKSVVEVLRAA
ncbi:MAG: sulfate adenylyltransferase [Cyanobacteria bacterium MAG STY4_bin_9]|jgi:sulfate adenylyltransferase|uniref:sulfate adenylyltransferase n=1 Tax=unclassified Synechococcus TaxID=2626047 RepID=UPI000B1553EF|nr:MULTISPECIES: sulfate adenylyltransferase [unclassified Synechococcus]MBN89223.1 sulfate adenylyltransferase [Synechococcus sp. RS344]MCH1545093.1 sulfate adenylyltransferase [Synechococcus sp. MOX_bin32]MDD9805067.1 sulfate adenylyltransferase [Cyanobacteria bacterium MAG STY1_bin_7]MDD9861944.1 sulfate adenylyltransferase [Cyanobacteria bacterium MAG STY2_bin_7]MDD9881957.1 sulfate adenylyltransferase [Cyanobacteria bacterium MAG STY4_bin_9]MEC8731899.1 sulfate adenylyltransferase [Cyano